MLLVASTLTTSAQLSFSILPLFLPQPRAGSGGPAELLDPEQPWTREPRRELNPRVAASSLWTRLGALRGDRAFREAYRAARAAWQQGKPAVFPAGTYWLRRFAGVQVAQGPPE